MEASTGLARYRGDIVSAFQYGLMVFTLTALIGLANALQIFGALDRNTLLTHLHSGTLGWITMGVIGLAIWVYGETGAGGSLRTAVRLSALMTVLYVLAFWSGNFYLRAITGVGELVVILGWWGWIGRRAMAIGFGALLLPQLALLLSTTVLVIGSILGVTAQILYATGAMTPQLGESIVGGHASAQVGGYLVLSAAAAAEKFLSRQGGRRTVAGLIQVYGLFVAGLIFAGSQLFGLVSLAPLASMLQTIGTVMFVVRLGPAALGAGWGSPGGLRHIAASVPFLAIGVVLLVYMVNLITAAQGDFSKVPPGLIHALDHAMFIGVMTNVIFGAIRLIDPTPGSLVDHVIFWGLNLGALSFVYVLVAIGSHTPPVAYTAPVMGLSALLGIATYLSRLRAEPARA